MLGRPQRLEEYALACYWMIHPNMCILCFFIFKSVEAFIAFSLGSFLYVSSVRRSKNIKTQNICNLWHFQLAVTLCYESGVHALSNFYYS